MGRCHLRSGLAVGVGVAARGGGGYPEPRASPWPPHWVGKAVRVVLAQGRGRRGGTSTLGGALRSPATVGMGCPTAPLRLLHVPQPLLCLLCLLPPLLRVSVGSMGRVSGWGHRELGGGRMSQCPVPGPGEGGAGLGGWVRVGDPCVR